MKLLHGDCLPFMREMDSCSVDSVVTDPPYGLSFMGKCWDHGVPGVAFWVEALRVAKPGAHLLAFGGTRTYHRLACAIEDAGWEIRDCVMWVYGSGFPKSLDVSKAIDKMDASQEQEMRRLRFTAWVRASGVRSAQIDEATQSNMGGHYTTAASQPAIMTREHLEACRHLFSDVPAWVERECDIRSVESKNFAEREVVGTEVRYNSPSGIVSAGRDKRTLIERKITAPATDAAKQWQGWGTALKPAFEPIIVARKPLCGTVAENVLKHGTGGINVDGCRVDASDGRPLIEIKAEASLHAFGNGLNGSRGAGVTTEGRWPANLIHDGSDEVARLLGDAARFFYCAKASKADRDEGCEGLEERVAGVGDVDESSGRDPTKPGNQYGEGSRRRVERGLPPTMPRRNHHPTVKPTALMRYLCRLVTPPGGTVLDPFMGSGSTGKAAVLEGLDFIGIERELEYLEIARRRIEAVHREVQP